MTDLCCQAFEILLNLRIIACAVCFQSSPGTHKFLQRAVVGKS